MVRQKQNNWQRIESVIKWANMSTNYFARHIGLPRGENLYQIKRGNNGISLDVAERIVTSFPQIDKLWLLTGEGGMFVEARERTAAIPFYNIDIEQGIGLLDHLEPESELVFPQLGKCDLAMYYVGRAMGELIPPGTVVVVQQIDPDVIIPGGEYVIVSRKIVTLRIVRAAESVDAVRLVAGDSAHFDDIILKIRDIDRVYKVKGKVIINN